MAGIDMQTVALSDVFPGTQQVPQSDMADPDPVLGTPANQLIGEAEAKAVSNILGLATPQTAPPPETKGEPSKDQKPEEEKPDEEKKIPDALRWIIDIVDSGLEDVEDARRKELEDQIWSQLLATKIGDGTQSGETKQAILAVVNNVLGGKEQPQDGDIGEPSKDTKQLSKDTKQPVDLGTLTAGSSVLVNTEGGDVVIAEVVYVKGGFVTVETNDGRRLKLAINDVTPLDVDNSILDCLLDQNGDPEELIDRMLEDS